VLLALYESVIIRVIRSSQWWY